MNTVILKPSTARFRQLVRAHGAVWQVIASQDSVQCFNGAPGLFIRSMDQQHDRWVRPESVEPLQDLLEQDDDTDTGGHFDLARVANGFNCDKGDR